MNTFVAELTRRYPRLSVIEQKMEDTIKLIANCYENGGKVFIAGNGGSAADADHIVGELMKSFVLPRPLPENLKSEIEVLDPDEGKKLANALQVGLPAISLNSHVALSTAVINDIDGQYTMAQQLLGLGKKNDVLIAISTSGNSRNVLYATTVAKALGMQVVGMTNENGGKLQKCADIIINVPETETYKVQELHLPIYHCICLAIESYFFEPK